MLRNGLLRRLPQAPRSRASAVRLSSALAAQVPPLHGVRVLDFTGGHAGPLSTMLLGDLGADVIKVESPRGGDPSREWGLKVPPKHSADASESAFFLGVNRNKRSLALDVENETDVALLKSLIPKFDVVVTDWTVERAERLGLDFESAMATKSSLIYCSVTGYGQTGPYKNIIASDGTLCAETGLTYCTGEPQRDPVRPQIAPTDHATAYFAYGSVMAALLSKDLTGEGVYIDVAGFDSQIASMGNVGGAYLNAGMEYTRVGTAHPTVVPYEVFATSDGCLMIGTGNNSQFERLAEAMGRPELAQEAKFCTNALRVANRTEIVPIITEIMAAKSSDYWKATFAGKGFPFGAINNMEQTFAHPQVAARGITTEMEHSTLGTIRAVSPAVLYDGARMTIRYPPPTLGQHTAEVLAELATPQVEQSKARLEEAII